MLVAVDLLPLRPGGENGGVKPFILNLLKSAADQAGDSVRWAYLTNSATHEEIDRLVGDDGIIVCMLEDPSRRCSNLKFDGQRSFLFLNDGASFLQHIGVDVAYCPFGACTLVPKGMPAVVMIVDLLHKNYPHSLSKHDVAFRDAYLTETIGKATLFQVISHFVGQELHRLYGVPWDAIFRTYIPIHHRLVKSGRNAGNSVNRRFRPCFYYPANFWVHKNHEALLLAYRIYRHRRIAAGDLAYWPLILTGHDDKRARDIKELAWVLGLHQDVHFMGFVPEAELGPLWSQVGALVFPSLHEGFGIPLLEAAFHNVPVVADECPLFHELLGDGYIALDARKPLALAGAMEAVSSRPELRHEKLTEAHERLILFDLQTETSRFLESLHRARRLGWGGDPNSNRSRGTVLWSLATPCSRDEWCITSRWGALAQRVRVFLDEHPFSVIRPDELNNGTHSFSCRPEGRTLQYCLDQTAETTPHDPPLEVQMTGPGGLKLKWDFPHPAGLQAQ